MDSVKLKELASQWLVQWQGMTTNVKVLGNVAIKARTKDTPYNEDAKYLMAYQDFAIEDTDADRLNFCLLQLCEVAGIAHTCNELGEVVSIE